MLLHRIQNPEKFYEKPKWFE